MNKMRKKVFWQQNYWILIIVVTVLGSWIVRRPEVWDFWKGFAYEASADAAEIREKLDLTGKGERIFNATWLAVEESDDFNQHCDSHDEEIALLGCYTDGKIYIYGITEEQLETANIVTAAHELLHAAWERMTGAEQRRIERMLTEVYENKKEWFQEELEAYDESEYLEEVWTRAGTKLKDLPDELEREYAKYFRNRAQIVEFYEQYEAPFALLRTEMEQLAEKIERISAEIEQGREQYNRDAEKLDLQIDQFNACAETAGCFRSQTEFERRRYALVAERDRLEQVRESLNQKITENNQRIEDYQAKQRALGNLSDAMNSNILPTLEAQEL